MSIRYDYGIQSHVKIETPLSIISIGDLVWWGSILNIGKTEHLGIIIDAQWEFGFNESVYKIYTNNGILETSCIFPFGDALL